MTCKRTNYDDDRSLVIALVDLAGTRSMLLFGN